jgi:hypothetical protein
MLAQTWRKMGESNSRQLGRRSAFQADARTILLHLPHYGGGRVESNPWPLGSTGFQNRVHVPGEIALRKFCAPKRLRSSVSALPGPCNTIIR